MATTFRAKVIKIGSELGVIIPPELLAQTGIKVGDTVSVTFEKLKKPK